MITDPNVVDSPGRRAAVIRLRVPKDRLQEVFGPAIGELFEALQAQGIQPTGAVYARYFGLKPDEWDFEVGVPVDAEVEPDGRVRPGELPEARVARTLYRGPYEGLPDAWERFREWAGTRDDVEAGEEFWERYVTGPESDVAPDDYRTELSWTLVG